jgi:hypothetical protein
VKTIVEV